MTHPLLLLLLLRAVRVPWEVCTTLPPLPPPLTLVTLPVTEPALPPLTPVTLPVCPAVHTAHVYLLI